MDDLRITAEALDAQAAIARQAGRQQLSENLLRAAELVNVPDDVILSVYNSLRPGRASKDDLQSLAKVLEREYGANRCATLIREAAAVK